MIIIIDSFIVVGSGARVGISERRNGRFGVGAFEGGYGETHDDSKCGWVGAVGGLSET